MPNDGGGLPNGEPPYDAEAGDDLLHRRIENLERPLNEIRSKFTGFQGDLRGMNGRLDRHGEMLFEIKAMLEKLSS